MTDKLNINNEMRALDLKHRDFYDELSEEEKKKFSAYLMIRWSSAVMGSAELQEYYLLSANQKINRHFFSINATRHKKLLWLLATSVSPDIGAQKHTWIPPKPRTSNGPAAKMVREMMPHLRDDEVDLLCQINTKKQITEAMRAHGNQD